MEMPPFFLLHIWCIWYRYYGTCDQRDIGIVVPYSTEYGALVGYIPITSHDRGINNIK